MTLSQAVLCIDKHYCKNVSISVEFGDGSRSEVFKFSPNATNEIFTRISPFSRVLAFLNRKGSVNIVVAYAPNTFMLVNQMVESRWDEELYV